MLASYVQLHRVFFSGGKVTRKFRYKITFLLDRCLVFEYVAGNLWYLGQLIMVYPAMCFFFILINCPDCSISMSMASEMSLSTSIAEARKSS